MNQLQLVLDKLKAKKIQDSSSGIGNDRFDFFMIKIITLQDKAYIPNSSRSSLSIGAHSTEGAERAVQFIDLSEKIFMDNLYTERKYLTYINATVSHEMRNPLNSINAQISHQTQLIQELEHMFQE